MSIAMTITIMTAVTTIITVIIIVLIMAMTCRQQGWHQHHGWQLDVFERSDTTL